MQKYAIIQNGVVVNIIDYETTPTNPPPGFDDTYSCVQSDTAEIGYTYENEVFTNPNPVVLSNQQLLEICKIQAQALLQATDWSTLSDVTTGTPKLTNQADFLAYRSQVRALAINPVINPTFPTLPTEQWA